MSTVDVTNANADDVRSHDEHQGTRSSPRSQTTLRLVRIVSDGDEGLARLRNISDRGVGLHLYMPVSPGERLIVQLGDTASIAGQVVWKSGAACGLALDGSIDSSSLLTQLGVEGQQAAYRPLRLSVDVTATASGEHGTRHVELVDISQRGIKFRHDGGFIKGYYVTVTLPSGADVCGVVRWSRDGFAGLLLLKPLSVEALGSVRNL